MDNLANRLLYCAPEDSTLLESLEFDETEKYIFALGRNQIFKGMIIVFAYGRRRQESIVFTIFKSGFSDGRLLIQTSHNCPIRLFLIERAMELAKIHLENNKKSEKQNDNA